MARPPATLLVYRWMETPVYLRLVQNGNRQQIPPCPRLYDEVVQIPVIAAGQDPPDRRMQHTPLVADWLADITEEREL